MSDSQQRLPSIARQLKGEEHRLTQLLIQLGGNANSYPDVWRALVERAVVCLRWAQDAILSASAQEEETPAGALPAQTAKEEQGHGVGGLSSVVPVFTALQMLTGLGKSGSLRVECSDGSFEVRIERGTVVYAQGTRPAPGERLGEILVRLGVLIEAELQAALEQAQAQGESVGTLLIRNGLVTHEQLTTALAEQACAVFSRMHASGDARWHFEECETGEGPQDGRMDATPIMLRSVHEAQSPPQV